MEDFVGKTNGDASALVEKNMRLVLKIANDFLGRGLPWDDLVSEGNRGLITAANRFNPARGAKFSTYSSWWIKQTIRQALAEQVGTIRVPIGTQLHWRRIKRREKELRESLGREPEDAEIAAACNLPLATVKRLRNRRKIDVQSLNAAVSDEESESAEFMDLLADEKNPPPDQQQLREEDIQQLTELLNRLPEREQMILNLRFGLDGEPIHTLEEVGKIIGCTNERVRQIQNQALRKLQIRMIRNK